MRYLVACITGIGVALSLFLFMQVLIANQESSLAKNESIPLPDFIRLKREEIIQERKREIPKKPPPPKEPPPPPKLQVAKVQERQVPKIDMKIDRLNIPNNIKGGAFLGRFDPGDAQQDGELIALVRIEPRYPPKAARAGITGYVIVSLNITAGGSVEKASVVESKPARIFNRAALRAVRKWKFKPKIVDGIAVAQVATQRIDFNLNGG